MKIEKSRRLPAFEVLVSVAVAAACASSGASPSASSAPDTVDPAIYERIDDPSDPFRAKYAEFRERRARDMADPDSPRPLDRYPAFHRTSERPWDAIEERLPWDWAALRAEAPEAADQLASAVRIRLAFDHPDLKITQLMIGPGGLVPAHAEGAPAAFIVVGGSGEITVEGETRRVLPGATVKLAPYAVRRLEASPQASLRVLWIRWAPGGDQSYVDAAYYLTGANQHVQPARSDMPDDYLFWGAVHELGPREAPTTPIRPAARGTLAARDTERLEAGRQALGAGRDPYPGVPVFGHESRIPWLSAEVLKGSGFFFAEDIGSLGPVADRMIAVARHKAIFRATRTNGRWDFNFSQTAWGPRSTYVEHSHVIPEFYYVMSGPVIYGVDGVRYEVRPGDIIFNNSYSPHLNQGIVDDLVFDTFSSTFAPNGDRTVFSRPMLLLEPPGEQPDSARLPEDAAFH